MTSLTHPRDLVGYGGTPPASKLPGRARLAVSMVVNFEEGVERAVEATKKATGQRPMGFFCRGSESRETRALLRDLGFTYASNGFDDDLPYWDKADPRRPLLVVPYALDSNDMKFFHPNGFVQA